MKNLAVAFALLTLAQIAQANETVLCGNLVNMGPDSYLLANDEEYMLKWLDTSTGEVKTVRNFDEYVTPSLNGAPASSLVSRYGSATSYCVCMDLVLEKNTTVIEVYGEPMFIPRSVCK